MMGMGPMDGPPPDPDRMADGILAHLTQQLTLSDDQKAKIKPIITAQVAQFQKEMEDRRQEMQKEMADGRAKIRALLNPDQQKELDQLPVPGEKPGDTADANPPAK
jgi:Spy/CpxP family protein refolding chaperone